MIVRYMRYLCPALQAAHSMGVVHGDLKTSNIRIDPEHHAHVLDFGLASLAGDVKLSARQQRIYVTPHYTAPEQIEHPEAVDQRADIYSLGVILFELATGRVPLQAPNVEEVFRMHREVPPPRPRDLNPELPAVFDSIVLRCLEKDPERRYESALELLTELTDAIPKEARAGPGGLLTVTPSGHGKVLVIDHEDRTRVATAQRFLDCGMIAVEARGLDEALDYVVAEKPTLVLLDLEMPDALETLLLLKSNLGSAAIPVVVTARSALNEHVPAALERGAIGVLTKPVLLYMAQLLAEKYKV